MTASVRWLDRIDALTAVRVVGWGSLVVIVVLVIAGSWWIGMWKP